MALDAVNEDFDEDDFAGGEHFAVKEVAADHVARGFGGHDVQVAVAFALRAGDDVAGDAE